MSSSSWLMESGLGHRAYNRKQKSLGLLCSNFVSLCDQDDVESVGLDDAARRLGVERRRIYDIVNVMESVGVLTRKAKNQYSWIGFSGIPQALDELKAEASKEISCSGVTGSCIKEALYNDDSIDASEDFGEEKLSQSSTTSSVNAPLMNRSALDHKKEKSLSLLTQNFVKLFLTTNSDTITLEEAAKMLLGDGHDSSIMRTKVRRLYDIANVLSSMNLIEKTHQAETRKPAFRWLGLEGKQDKRITVAIPHDRGVTVAIPPNATQWNKRAFAADITNLEFKRPKLCSLADTKPTNDVRKECSITAQKQHLGSKDYVFGPFCPNEVIKADVNTEEKIQGWETLASAFRPQYHNQALHDLFAHYMEAWKSWFVEAAQGSKSLEESHRLILNQIL